LRSTVSPDRRVHALSSWPRLLIAIVVGAGMVAACSGGGSTAAPASAGAAATAQAPSTAPADSAAPAETQAPAVTQAPAGGATVDVCAMLSAADVKSITGADTTAAVESTSWSDWVAGECWWNSSDMSVRFSVDVGTQASIAKSTSPTAAEQLALEKMVLQGFGNVEDISGVGDGAIYGSGFLTAIKGGSMIEIFALTPKKDQLVAIAKLVLAKL